MSDNDNKEGDWNRNHFIYFSGGDFRVGGILKKNQGIGFKKGETITVTLNMN